MKTLERSIDIPAPPDAVWDVLNDVNAYAEWNPFMSIDRTPTRIGDRLTVTIGAGRRPMTFRPVVTAVDRGVEVAWLGHFVVRGLVDGAHSLSTEVLADGSTRFHQRETFRGALVPFLGRMLRRTDQGFAAMNTALAERVLLLGSTRTS